MVRLAIMTNTTMAAVMKGFKLTCNLVISVITVTPIITKGKINSLFRFHEMWTVLF